MPKQPLYLRQMDAAVVKHRSERPPDVVKMVTPIYQSGPAEGAPEGRIDAADLAPRSVGEDERRNVG
jgi:hypothetical protein